jgi:hypothetical protein
MPDGRDTGNCLWRPTPPVSKHGRRYPYCDVHAITSQRDAPHDSTHRKSDGPASKKQPTDDLFGIVPGNSAQKMLPLLDKYQGRNPKVPGPHVPRFDVGNRAAQKIALALFGAISCE